MTVLALQILSVACGLAGLLMVVVRGLAGGGSILPLLPWLFMTLLSGAVYWLCGRVVELEEQLAERDQTGHPAGPGREDQDLLD